MANYRRRTAVVDGIGVHQGFDALTDYIHWAEPKLVIHGHQHQNRKTLVGRTTVIGVYGHRRIEA